MREETGKGDREEGGGIFFSWPTAYNYQRVANSCVSPESTHTFATPTRGQQLTGAPPPANLVAHPQLVRLTHFPEMECWEPSAISLETQMEGHLGGTGVDGRQLTAGRGEQRKCTQRQPSTCTKRCPAQCIGEFVVLENQHYH